MRNSTARDQARVRVQGFVMVPHEPLALQARVGEPEYPGTHVPVADVSEGVLPGQTALLSVAAGQRLPSRDENNEFRQRAKHTGAGRTHG